MQFFSMTIITTHQIYSTHSKVPKISCQCQRRLGRQATLVSAHPSLQQCSPLATVASATMWCRSAGAVRGCGCSRCHPSPVLRQRQGQPFHHLPPSAVPFCRCPPAVWLLSCRQNPVKKTQQKLNIKTFLKYTQRVVGGIQKISENGKPLLSKKV